MLRPKETVKIICPEKTGRWVLTNERLLLEQGELNVELLGQGFTWLDTGTHESLVDATNFVKTMESHQHRKIGCLEEIAYLNGWISGEEVMKVIRQVNYTGTCPLFYLQGGWAPQKVGWFKRRMVGMATRTLRRTLQQKGSLRTQEEEQNLNYLLYGGDCVAYDKLAPIRSWLKEQQ